MNAEPVDRAPDEGRTWRERLARPLLWAAAAAAAFQATVRLDRAASPWQGLALLLVATALMFAATWRQPARAEGLPESAGGGGDLRGALRIGALPLAVLVIAIGLGTALRFFHLTSAPAGIWFDEAQNGIIADRLLHDAHYHPVFITEYVGTNRPSLPVYVFGGAMELLGRGIFALRSVSALAGILTLFALFFLGWELFNARVGALAALLLAVMRWHFNFSRLAMEPIWGPFFAVSSMLFLVRGVRRGRWYDFAASGVLLGLALYFYWACLLIPVLYAVYAAHSFLARRSASLSRLARGAALVALTTFVVYLPVVAYAVQHPDQYKQRGNGVSITRDKGFQATAKSVLHTTRLHTLMFNVEGDRNARHNLQGAPMLDTLTGAFFLLGVGMALTKARRPGHFLLLAWLVVLIQPGVWSTESDAPQSLRSILVTPAVALLAALPLASLWEMAEADLSRSSGRSSGARPRLRRIAHANRYLVAGAIVIAIPFLLAEIAYNNWRSYFDKQLGDPPSWTASDADVTFAAREMLRLGPDYRYVLSEHLFGRPSMEFINPQAPSQAEYSADFPSDFPLARIRATAVFLDGTHEAYFYWLWAQYPNAITRHVGPTRGSDQGNSVYELIIPPEDIERVVGIQARYQPASGESVGRREPSLELDWTSSLPVALPFEAHWSGLLRILQKGSHVLEVQAPGILTVRLNGQLLGTGAGRVVTTEPLLAGLHRLEIEATIDRPGRVSFTDNARPVPSQAYFSTSSDDRGLLASFFDTEDWSGRPLLQRVDPAVGFFFASDIPLSGLTSVTWTGSLRAPASGSYSFEIEVQGEGAVTIDGRDVLATPDETQTVLDLTAGLHELTVRYANPGVERPQIFLYWTPPGGDRKFIATQLLSPSSP